MSNLCYPCHMNICKSALEKLENYEFISEFIQMFKISLSSECFKTSALTPKSDYVSPSTNIKYDLQITFDEMRISIILKG